MHRKISRKINFLDSREHYNLQSLRQTKEVNCENSFSAGLRLINNSYCKLIHEQTENHAEPAVRDRDDKI